MPRLVIINGIGKGTIYEITHNVTLGRASSNQIQLFGKQISRRHALIKRQDNDFIIQDLKSKNGVYVNEQRISEHLLRPGDEITIGTISLVYEPPFKISPGTSDQGNLFILPGEASKPTSLITTSIREDITVLEETSALVQELTKFRETTTQESRNQEAHRRLQALYEIASVGSATFNEIELLQRVTQIILNLFKIDRVAFLFCNESGTEIYPALIYHRSGKRSDITLSQTVLNEVLCKRRIVFTPDTEIDPRFTLTHSIRVNKIKSICCIPLIVKDKLLGTLYLDSQTTSFSKDEYDIDFLVTISRQLSTVLENIRLYHQLKKEIKTLSQHIQDEVQLVGNDKTILEVVDRIRKVAPLDSTVLITGETGTGKELVARAIHYNSQRRDKPFIVVDCATIPASLLESELFGHEKGAFTGADKAHVGKFEQANGGTIFLDEISTLNLETQAKFLRVLEERKFTRVGGIKLLPANVRIIAATNVNLEAKIKQGTFRQDLYYRLAVVPINLPPLRERKDDIPLLINYFFSRFVKASGKNITTIVPATMKYLVDYSWPGNVRELRNVIERAVVLCEKTMITPADLPSYITKTFPSAKEILKAGLKSSSLDEILAHVEKECITQALSQAKGNKSVAARLLKISRPTLHKKIVQYGLK